jgi:glucose/arabinose dehydrogenase
MLVPAEAAGLPARTRVRLYKGGLAFPVDMAHLPGTHKIFFTEKNSGRIRVMRGRRLLRRPCRDLDVESGGEQGALGIVLHPRFNETHWLYVYYTNDSPRENRVTRFTVRRNRCRNAKRIEGGIRASSGYHNGGQLDFVGGKLFVTTGEQHNPALAQNTNNRLGKVLRLEPDGSIPRGNPFSSPGDRNPVWTYGHRNPFGLTHRSGPTRIYSTENGPNCDDELNLIVKGRNYGWGDGYQCGTAGVGRNPKKPIFRWRNVVAPTDAWWYRGRMKRLNGDVYIGDYGGGRLHRMVMNRRGTDVRSHRVMFDSSESITDVSKGPGGWLYFLTTGGLYRIVRS